MDKDSICILTERQAEYVQALMEDVTGEAIHFDLVNGDTLLDFNVDEETGETLPTEITAINISFSVAEVLDALAQQGLALVPIEMVGENVARAAYLPALNLQLLGRE